MKKSNKVLLVLLMFLISSMLCACEDKKTDLEQNEQTKETPIRTFADWTKQKEFQTVPVMLVENTKIGEATDYGGDTYVISVNGTELSDYQAYLDTMEEAGFVKYSDNGETGIDEAVYTTTFTKDELVVTVTHAVNIDITYIAACQNMKLSEHLIYKEEYLKNIKPELKTSIHMLEMYDYGNSFVIQLKNGHFIVNDGGMETDLEYLLDYMESLTPEGEKPMIDAWIISHAHDDHMGVFRGFVKKSAYIQRVSVEGVYYSEPSETTATKFGTGVKQSIEYVNMASKFLKTSKGESTPLYRMQTGQKYYFCDIVVEVPLTQEQILFENHYRDFNDTSTWLMYYIDGQKVLLCGDADLGSMNVVMEIYSKDYFSVDIYTVFHHGINVFDEFTDYITFNTALYPCYRTGSIWPDGEELASESENAYLKETAVECYAYGNGTVVLTFPYKLGTARSLSAIDWTQYTKKRDFRFGREESYSVR